MKNSATRWRGDEENPAARTDPREHEVARNLKEEISKKEHARAETEHGKRKSEIATHGERREPDIHPVEEVHREQQHHERNQPPGAFGEDGLFILQLR